MKIVIIGAGKVGFEIAKELSGENHDIVIIDGDKSTVDNIVGGLDILGVVGNGALADIQLEAGVKNADIVMAVTRSDETNIVCCLVARSLGAKRTIARVREPDYSAQSEFMRDRLGIDMLVNPEHEAAEEIARHLRYPGAEHVDVLRRGKADLVGVRTADESPFVGRQLREIVSEMKLKMLVCAVERDGEVIIPDGSTEMRAGDVVYFTGNYKSVDAMLRKTGHSLQPVGSMIIIGGGRISLYLARILLDSGIKVKIIEQDMERCRVLSEALPKAAVICGDGGDKQILIEEGIDIVDSFVTLTGNDEENILLSLFAKTRGVDKIITKVNGESFTDLLSTLDIGTVISPKAVTSERIVKLTRSLQAPEGSSVRALYRIVGDKAEAVSFSVGDNSEFVGKRVRDIKFKPGVLLASIIRGRDYILPDGNAVFENGDEVLVVSASYKFKNLSEVLQ